MEVIARKKEGLLALYIGVTIFVVAFVVGSLVQFTVFDNSSTKMLWIFMLALGVALIGICAWVLVKLIRTPQVLIAYENGKLRFANGLVCSPQEVASVNYRRARARGFSYRWGDLTVTALGQEVKLHYIADVEQAHDRILQLMLEAREKHNG